MTVESRHVQLMDVHRIQSLSLRIVIMSLDRGILKSRSRYVSLTGWTPSDPAVLIAVIQRDFDISDSIIGINGQDLASVAESLGSGFSTDSLFINKSGNNVLGKLWPLVKNVRSVGGFAWGVATLV
ncbi:hypothetical protein M9H77_13618 [Catharanthus roseus]|uniref:Uncharacterized protein n=1 Tax=Catharanthus roseus TaxID=4058 RepID=A0ACC0BL00_CATRO|nr:hypothetical protein M9H77_13618 [Catharanthus roseus]